MAEDQNMTLARLLMQQPQAYEQSLQDQIRREQVWRLLHGAGAAANGVATLGLGAASLTPAWPVTVPLGAANLGLTGWNMKEFENAANRKKAAEQQLEDFATRDRK